MTVGDRKRKIRSDKKRDVKPTISVDLRELIYRISYITSTPVKDVAEEICKHGITSQKVVELLSAKFRRSVMIGNTMYIGDLGRVSSQRDQSEEERERISIRFKQGDYEDITTLAFGLDVTPSRAVALLLDVGIRNNDFINNYFEKYVSDQLDERRTAELKDVLGYLNENNPYKEEISWVMLLSFLAGEVRESATTMKETISLYIKKWK